jgi:ATP-dependent Clp protease adaptor protein ClpS
MTEHQDDPGGGVSVLEEVKIQTEPPRLYKVLLRNDDYTPMDFVVYVLQRFFAMDQERAEYIMLKVHHEGLGLCGIYSRDIAATKVGQVTDFALQHQHPLVCFMEEEDQ